MRLSKRLEMVADFAGRDRSRGRQPGKTEKDPWYRVADVGTDHGYVPIALALRDPAVRAVAMDIRPGPLKRAEEHIEEYGLGDRIETRLGDGVKELKAGEAETVIIAGMGGELVLHILEGGRHLWKSVDRWILSPQSEPDKVRRYLENQGFAITGEDMVEEEGKYYTVMEAVRGELLEPDKAGRDRGLSSDPELAEAGYLYGMDLIRGKNPVLMEFLKREKGKLTEILRDLEGRNSSRTEARSEELRQKLSWIRRAVEEMGLNTEEERRETR